MGVVRSPGSLRRTLRGHGLVRSPLRRGTHRIEAALTALLALLGVVVVPVACTLALGIYQRERAEAAADAAQRAQVDAVLVSDAVASSAARSDGIRTATAVATWQLPSGQRFTDRLRVTPNQHAGDSIRIWSDQQGHRTTAPKSQGDVLAAALIIGVDLVILGWLLLVAVWWLGCWVLDRFNALWWEIQWAQTGPRWSRRA